MVLPWTSSPGGSGLDSSWPSPSSSSSPASRSMVGVAAGDRGMRRWFELVAAVLMIASVLLAGDRARAAAERFDASPALCVDRRPCFERARWRRSAFAEAEVDEAIARCSLTLRDAAPQPVACTCTGTSSTPHGDLLMTLLHEWVATASSRLIADPENQGFPTERASSTGRTPWRAGCPCTHADRRPTGAERSDMEARVAVLRRRADRRGGAWWGFLGFDDCRRERDVVGSPSSMR